MPIILAAANGVHNVQATWVGNVVPGVGDTAVLNGKSVTMGGDWTCAEIRSDATDGAVVGGVVLHTNAGSNLVANLVQGHSSTALVQSSMNFGLLNHVGTIAQNDNGPIFSVSGNATIYSTGIITQGANVSGTIAAIASNKEIRLTGTITASAANVAVLLSNTGVGKILHTGAITVGAGSSNGGVRNASTGQVHLDTVTGGTAANGYGVVNVVGGTVFSIGKITGGSGSNAHGIHHASIGAAELNEVAANNYPNGGLVNSSVGSNNAGNSQAVYIKKMLFGTGGLAPVIGRHFLRDDLGNQCKMPLSVSSNPTMAVLSSFASDFPAAADVRAGVTYNSATQTGACAVPPAGSVALGVPVDAVVGTAALTAADIRAAVGLAAANLDAQLSGQLAAITAVQADSTTIIERIAAQVPAGPVLVIPAPADQGSTAAYGYALDDANNLVAGVTFELLIVKTPGTTAPLSYPAGAHKAVSDANGLYTFTLPRGTGFKFKIRRGQGSWVGIIGVDADTLALPELLG